MYCPCRSVKLFDRPVRRRHPALPDQEPAPLLAQPIDTCMKTHALVTHDTRKFPRGAEARWIVLAQRIRCSPGAINAPYPRWCYCFFHASCCWFLSTSGPDHGLSGYAALTRPATTFMHCLTSPAEWSSSRTFKPLVTWLHHKRRSATISSPCYFSCPPTAAQPVTKFCAVLAAIWLLFR